MYRKIPNSSTARKQKVVENYLDCSEQGSLQPIIICRKRWPFSKIRLNLLLGEPACESTLPEVSRRLCFPGTKVAWCQHDDFVDMALICHRQIISVSAEACVKYSSLNQSCLAPLWPLEYIILLSNAQYTSICQHSILSVSLFSIQISSPFTSFFCMLAFCGFISFYLQIFWDFLFPFLLLLPLHYLSRGNMCLLQPFFKVDLVNNSSFRLSSQQDVWTWHVVKGP